MHRESEDKRRPHLRGAQHRAAQGGSGRVGLSAWLRHVRGKAEGNLPRGRGRQGTETGGQPRGQEPGEQD